jgi:hypothetical protein
MGGGFYLFLISFKGPLNKGRFYSGKGGKKYQHIEKQIKV